VRRRPDPLHLAVAALVIGLAVFLTGVGMTWRSSDRASVTLGGATGLVAPAESASTTEPDIAVPPAGEPWGGIAPAVDPTTTAPPTTAAAAQAAPEPATTAAPTTATPAPAPTVPHGATAATAPFYGMGTWIDVFDWAPSYAKGAPVKLDPADVDVMADEGVQVLYIQTTRADYTGGGDIVDPGVLQQWLTRAEARNLQVVAWYLPTLTDVAADLRRLKATAGLATIDGIGVDIESKAVADHDERSRRLVELSRLARPALAGWPLSAITLPNVVTDVLNLSYWPRFPWTEIKPFYDVWQPMGYWTNRKADSPYRNAELYTRENVDRLRAKLGDPDAVVHPIGGIGDQTTTADIAGFLKAVRETRSVGASLYDWSTQTRASYSAMKAART
jgi:hypothetical protein